MTNWFEVYYSDFLKFATQQIRRLNYDVPFLPEDLVSEAYLKFFNSGLEFSEEVVRGYILDGIRKESIDKQRINLLGDSFTKRAPKVQGDFTCNYCKQTKNVNEFRLIKFEGYNFITKTCKSCTQKKQLEWFKANKKKWSAYMMERYWVSKNYIRKHQKGNAQPIHDLWKKANHKYIAKQKEMLTDVYVRSLLPKDKRTPQGIELKRKELIEKRNKDMNVAVPLTQV